MRETETERKRDGGEKKGEIERKEGLRDGLRRVCGRNLIVRD